VTSIREPGFGIRDPVWAGIVLLALIGGATSPLDAQAVLRWGGDAEGGAPFVEADPSDPNKLVGFDVEIAELIARQLGRTPQFVQVQFTSLDQSARRGDFDIGLSGIRTSRPAASHWRQAFRTTSSGKF
jgi:ABC-type amino acid transport substrate-binding protein